jgi:Trypsin-co-occurring domain 1
MRQLVEYQIGNTEDGPSIVVEVDEPVGEAGEERVAFRSWKNPVPAADDLESALARVTPAAELVLAKLQGLAERPDEATIVFGIKLTGKAGAVLASAGVEATFNVTLMWKRDVAPGPGDGG